MGNRSELKIDIIKFGKGSKKKIKKHPAGGHYWGPLKDTPKRYQEHKPRVMNA
jgi:hypothetical protein